MIKHLTLALAIAGFSFTLPALADSAPTEPLAVASASSSQTLSPLTQHSALQALLSDSKVRVLDLRAPEDYAAGHIPGAINTPYGRFRGPQDNPGQLRSAAELTELLRQAGIDHDSRVIIAHGGKDSTDFGAAARVYWTLKVGGLQQLSILDGGTRLWAEKGGQLSQEKPAIQPSEFSYQYDESQLVSSDSLAAELQNNTAPALIDARPSRFFSGEARVDAAARYGTLPGARDLDYNQFFAEDGITLKPLSQLQALVATAGLSSKPALSFCNTGHWAATNWFVISELAGNKEIKLYPASMVEWSKRDLPMENEPSRLTALYQDVKRALQ